MKASGRSLRKASARRFATHETVPEEMFKIFAKKKKKVSEIETLLQKGMLMLKGKLYKQATIDLRMAMEVDRERTIGLLNELFEENRRKDELEASYSVGLMLIRTRPQDHELCNQVGNIARKLHNYKQANSLYRQALRTNKEFSTAFYNMAASMGKVDKFDEEVKRGIDQFGSMKRFVLPDYRNDQTIVETLTRKWEKQEGSIGGDRQNLRESIYSSLKQAIKENREKQTTPKETGILHGDIFNLALYALSQEDGKTAAEYLSMLDGLHGNIKYSGMLNAITEDINGNAKKAIEDMLMIIDGYKNDRYFNANLGFMYRKAGNRLLSVKYFAIAASLLEKSDGQFSPKKILRSADRNFGDGNIRKALVLYRLVVAETRCVHAMLQIGAIYILKKDFANAHRYFREALHLDPNSGTAKEKLRGIHDHYCDKAVELFQANKTDQALILFERALSIERRPRTLDWTIKAYQKLRNIDRITALSQEYEKIKRKALIHVQEREREQFFLKGKQDIKKRDFTKAINNLESAFQIRIDKETFLLLAHIYKGLKRTHALQDLTRRWQQWASLQSRNKSAKLRKGRETGS